MSSIFYCSLLFSVSVVLDKESKITTPLEIMFSIFSQLKQSTKHCEEPCGNKLPKHGNM